MKVLVTGGAGFIGSNLAVELLNQGNEVIVVDDMSTGNERNLADVRGNPKLTIHKKSICDDLLDLFKGVDDVYHTAALARVQFSMKYPIKSNKANVEGTMNVLEMCRKADVKRLVYSSSSSVYGGQDKLPLTETMPPNPMSPYGAQKLIGEHYSRLYNLIYGIKTVNLRYFNVYGPRQDPHGGYALLIPKSIGLVLQGKSPIIFGDGEQTRDFTFIKDVVDANITAASTDNKEALGQAFNIGAGRNLSVNSVVKEIVGDTGIKPEHTDPVIEPRDTLADISKAKSLLGWSPKYEFEDGIKQTVEWFKQHKDILAK